MGGYKNGKVEIWYGDSPPSNLNILWQKRIVTDGVESSELMQYNPSENTWESLRNSTIKNDIKTVFNGTSDLNVPSVELVKNTIDSVIDNKYEQEATLKSWCAIGDSITWYDTHLTENMTKGYQSYVKDRLSFTNYTNCGWNGGG